MYNVLKRMFFVLYIKSDPHLNLNYALNLQLTAKKRARNEIVIFHWVTHSLVMCLTSLGKV